jgi:FkbM family methyltransferase
MHRVARFVRALRPAPLGSAVAKILGISRRRILPTPEGRFLVSPVSHLGWQLAEGPYEPSTTAVLKHYLKPGDVFIDLGANEGYFTVIGSALVGNKGRVIALEPQSRLMNVIHANLALNSCLNVNVIQAVVSAKTETMNLHLAPGLSTGGSSLSRNTRYRLPTEQVQSFALSEFLEKAGIGHCDLMKVDIEGAEYDVFMHAEPVLRAGIIRNIALEIHDSILERQGQSGAILHEWIVGCGYRMNADPGNRVYTFVGSSLK